MATIRPEVMENLNMRDRKPRGSGAPAIATGTVMITALAFPALANDGWDFRARLGVSTEVTDNVLLAPRGEESSDVIARISPGFDLSREGARAEMSLSYTLTSRFHLEETREDLTTHTIAGRGSIAVIPDNLFVEASVTRNVQTASLLDPIGFGDSTPRDNLAETSRYRISPYLTNRFSSIASQELRYTYDELRNHRNNDDGSRAHSVRYTLDSGPAFGRMFWQVAGQFTEERFADDGSKGEFGTVSGTLGLRVTPTLSASVTGGEDFNDFETDRGEVEGTFWEVGLGWTPTPVTNISASYGERFFGKTRALSVDHRSRRASYRISYSEGIDSTRGRGGARFGDLADQLGIGVEDLFDQFSIEEIGLLLLLSGLDDGALTRGFFFTQDWRASWQYDTGRSTVGISAFQNRRLAESRTGLGTLEDNVERRGITATLNWALGPRTRMELGTAFTRNSFLDSDREDDLWNFRAGINRELGPRTRASLSYRYQQRESDSPVDEYRENSLLATLTREF